MKILKIISVAMILSFIFGISSSAFESSGWYIEKRGNAAPGFPKEAQLVSEHRGYYIDKKSNEEGKKVLYLTFDAGYENGNVEKILDIMKSENVTGAFFILSNIINKNPDLIKRMVDEGHLVCNHTSNHKDLSSASANEIADNLHALEAKFEACTGAKLERYFRFPEGKYSESALIAVENLGYSTVFWSMAYDDWDNSRQPDCKKAMKKLLDTTHDGAIILLHPTSDTNAQILPDLIKTWKSMGYTFGSLNDIQ